MADLARDLDRRIGAGVEQLRDHREMRRLRQLRRRRLRPLHVAQIDRRIERRAAVRIGNVRVRAAIEQQRRQIVMAIDDGDQQRARRVGACLVDVGAAVEQRARGVELALARREQERGHAARRPPLLLRGRRRRQRRVRAAGKQQRDDFGMAFGRRPHQGRLAAKLLRVRVRTAIEQQLHGGGITRVRGQHQRRLALRRQHRVRVLAGVEQPRDRCGVAVRRREVERRRPRAIGEGVLRPGIEEHVHHLDVAALNGPMQGRHAVRLRCVHVGRLPNERPHRLQIAGLRGIDERGIGSQPRLPRASARPLIAGLLQALANMVE